jgi:hypothetical protein
MTNKNKKKLSKKFKYPYGGRLAGDLGQKGISNEDQLNKKRKFLTDAEAGFAAFMQADPIFGGLAKSIAESEGTQEQIERNSTARGVAAAVSPIHKIGSTIAGIFGASPGTKNSDDLLSKTNTPTEVTNLRSTPLQDSAYQANPLEKSATDLNAGLLPDQSNTFMMDPELRQSNFVTPDASSLMGGNTFPNGGTLPSPKEIDDWNNYLKFYNQQVASKGITDDSLDTGPNKFDLETFGAYKQSNPNFGYEHDPFVSKMQKYYNDLYSDPRMKEANAMWYNAYTKPGLSNVDSRIGSYTRNYYIPKKDITNTKQGTTDYMLYNPYDPNTLDYKYVPDMQGYSRALGGKLGKRLHNSNEITNSAQFNMMYSKGKKMAYGGGLTEVNGPSHEMGGFGMGENELEMNETIDTENQYVYSDRNKISKKLIKDMGLPKSWANKSPAKVSKMIKRKFDIRDDKMSKEAMQQDLDTLRNINEVMRQSIMKRAHQRAYGEDGMHQMPDGTMMQNNMMPNGGPINPDQPVVAYQGQPQTTYLEDFMKYAGDLGLQDLSNRLQGYQPMIEARGIQSIQTLPLRNRLSNKFINTSQYSTGRGYAHGGPIIDPETGLPIEDELAYTPEQAANIVGIPNMLNAPRQTMLPKGVNNIIPVDNTEVYGNASPVITGRNLSPSKTLLPTDNSSDSSVTNNASTGAPNASGLSPWGYVSAGLANVGKSILNATQVAPQPTAAVTFDKLSKVPAIQAGIEGRRRLGSLNKQIGATGSTSGQILANLGIVNTNNLADISAKEQEMMNQINAQNAGITNQERLNRQQVDTANKLQAEQFADQRYNNWDQILTNFSDLGQQIASDKSKTDMQNKIVDEWLSTGKYAVVNGKLMFKGVDEDGKTPILRDNKGNRYDVKGNLLNTTKNITK